MERITKQRTLKVLDMIKNSGAGYYSFEDMKKANFDANEIENLDMQTFENSMIIDLLDGWEYLDG